MLTECSFDGIPDEILQQILTYIGPESILRSIERLSRRFARVANEPLLWRYYCHSTFKYWDPRHDIESKLAGDATSVDWKGLFCYRLRLDFGTTTSLEAILASQTNRIQWYESIGEGGYDVKDTLLRHCRCDDSVSDVLARRYYSNSVLDHIHRAKALDEWFRTTRGEVVPLERALGAFDMFILHDQHGDMAEVSAIIDAYGADLRTQHADMDTLMPRARALNVVGYLRKHNLTGIANDGHYRDLQNNYIGIALQDPEHPSLPLISVAIFCALARRFGLDARCCGFPGHVHAVIYPPDGIDMDGLQVAHGSASPMFLDPWRTALEVPVETLESQLRAYGVTPDQFDRYMGSTGVEDMILRTSRNILSTVHAFRGLQTSTEHPSIQLYANPFADMDNAFYSALWANFLLFNPIIDGNAFDETRFIPMILERFERLYPMDAKFIEKYVCPGIHRSVLADQHEIIETIRVVRAGDSMPRQWRPRDTDAAKVKVKHRVGQVFKHRRYNYTAVITGWDVECTMNSEWMQHNRVDSLSNGRHQSFYHALVDDSSIRYVAEENIEIVEPDVPYSLLGLAGRYFKRWDLGTHKFVSNVRDEYPDD